MQIQVVVPALEFESAFQSLVGKKGAEKCTL